MPEGFSRLANIRSDNSIKTGVFAIHPGPRCPIAAITGLYAGIKGVLVLIVGMAECTYYNKHLSVSANGGPGNDNTWSYCVENHDVISGLHHKLQEALRVMDAEGPEAIILVSTCVPEVMGEDFGAIARLAGQSLRARVIPLSAPHFTCYSPVKVQMEAFSALTQLMEARPRIGNRFNLIGDGAQFAARGELMKLLQRHGAELHCVIPSKLPLDKLREAPAAALNIVTHYSAADLAESMKEAFGIPYVLLPHLLDPVEIRDAYEEIAGYLGLSLGSELEDLFARTSARLAEVRGLLEGLTVACGMSALDPFVAAAFLGSLGMKPVYVETEYYYSGNRPYKEQLIAMGHDPYVGRQFHARGTEKALSELLPDIYVGYPLIKPSGSPQIVPCQSAASALGFEQPLRLLEELLPAASAKEKNQSPV